MMSSRVSRKLVSLASTGFAALLLSACGGDYSDLEQYIAEVKSRPAEPISPIPPVKTYTPYVYEGIAGRDPFRSSTTDGSEVVAVDGNRSGPRPDFERPKEYLERFELDTLSMVGTFSKTDSYWGLIRDPDGVVHRVSVNNYMGKNHGKVTHIQGSEIAMSELISDGDGGWLIRDAAIALDGS